MTPALVGDGSDHPFAKLSSVMLGGVMTAAAVAAIGCAVKVERSVALAATHRRRWVTRMAVRAFHHVCVAKALEGTKRG